MLPPIEHRLALELGAKPAQVIAAVALLDEGATVPFIARYRKEATGGLDDTQLRLLGERLVYLRELEDRRSVVIASVEEQGKMTPTLLASILGAEDKTRLEDLYLPYRKKRRTKAQIALEAGLEPLADALLANPMLHPEEEARKYLKSAFTTAQGDNPGVADAKAALEGARHILMERFSEDAALLQWLREYVQAHGVVESKICEGKEEEGAKYADYFGYAESIGTIPSHRALAMLRGRREDILRVSLQLDSEAEKPKEGTVPNPSYNPCEARVAAHFGIRNEGRPADAWLGETVRWAWRVKIFLHLETELMGALRKRAEAEAIKVFARNLKDLLLAAPAGPRVTMGLDPGLRTGVKVAVVDATGKVLDTATIYPHQPRNDWNGSLAALESLAEKHGISLIAIGNGTASRETDKLVKELIGKRSALRLTSITVSEAGASVYSASEFASRELPELDVSLRGAVSIARRLQDPLAELVKVEPKSIGVGQYQHDVAQTHLARSLDAVVEDCVNAVGVDINTASLPLLERVSGLNSMVAQSIVTYRNQKGMFTSRAALHEVPRLGSRTFEQAAGFLRVMNGDNPLDASAVHPESYPVVERILSDLKQDIRSVIGNNRLLKTIDAAKYADDKYGIPTVSDILEELEKPGRDPRPAFTTATFREGVNAIGDLQPGMLLEGIVTNVTAFGAFVDIGVHQDGLVHISAMADTYVKDPHMLVKAGQIVKVKVLEIDEKRKRIPLSMRLTDSVGEGERDCRRQEQRSRGAAKPVRPQQQKQKQKQKQNRKEEALPNTAMAAAFAKLRG